MLTTTVDIIYADFSGINSGFFPISKTVISSLYQVF